MIRSKALLLTLILILGGCSAMTKSQFIQPSRDLRSEPLKIDNPEDKILLIYNHGSTSEEKADPCLPNNHFFPGAMPSIISDLVGKQISGKSLVVYALCTSIQGLIKTRDTSENLKIRYRINEIKTVIQQFTNLGVLPKNIFLVGHSAGGWASLMIEAKSPGLVNSVIAFSPAFSGVKSKRNEQWQQFRNDQQEELKVATKIDALVYAFRRDAYNSLADLSFFSEIPGVEYYPLSASGELRKCYRGHRAVFKRCFLATQSVTVVNFIAKKTAQ